MQKEIKPITELCDLLNYDADVAMSSLQLRSTRAMTVGTGLGRRKIRSSHIHVYVWAVHIVLSRITRQIYMYREICFIYP